MRRRRVEYLTASVPSPLEIYVKRDRSPGTEVWVCQTCSLSYPFEEEAAACCYKVEGEVHEHPQKMERFPENAFTSLGGYACSTCGATHMTHTRNADEAYRRHMRRLAHECCAPRACERGHVFDRGRWPCPQCPTWEQCPEDAPMKSGYLHSGDHEKIEGLDAYVFDPEMRAFVPLRTLDDHNSWRAETGKDRVRIAWLCTWNPLRIDLEAALDDARDMHADRASFEGLAGLYAFVEKWNRQQTAGSWIYGPDSTAVVITYADEETTDEP